jgi:DNA invertase Pin-like site-specific DNA recombinase
MNDPKIIEDVALYGRISRANGRDAEQLERHSKSEQREHATSILPRDTEHKTYRLVERDEWWDVNVSGKNFDRPGLNAVFEAVERGEVTSIAVGYLSRFGRNARELLDNLHRLHALGGTLYIGKQRLTAGPADRDPMGRLIITILAAFDELELARLTEQLDRSNRTARANGVAIQVPYGYKRENGPGSRLVFDEDGEHLPSDWTPACVVRHICTTRWSTPTCSSARSVRRSASSARARSAAPCSSASCAARTARSRCGRQRAAAVTARRC